MWNICYHTHTEDTTLTINNASSSWNISVPELADHSALFRLHALEVYLLTDQIVLNQIITTIVPCQDHCHACFLPLQTFKPLTYILIPLCYCLVVSTSAIHCLERIVCKMTCYVSTGMLSPTHSLFCLCTKHNCIWLLYMFCVWWMLFTVDNYLVERMVLRGDRPLLDVITGPADLVSFATRWIPLCWHQLPDQRPSFDGKYDRCCGKHDCH